MRTHDPRLISGFRKRAAALLTPEAEQAAAGGMPPQGGAPMDPAMAQGGAPMDPAMAGGMPPQGAPMDPSMQGGAPMDPAAMGGAPMDPAMQGGMPPQGGAPTGDISALLQDPMFMQFLQQALGAVVDPASGSVMGPDGAPIPPDQLMQIYQVFQQEMAAQGGQPGGMPPEGEDPAAMVGAPEDMGGMDPAMMADPQQLVDMVLSTVDTIIGEQMSIIEKKLSTILNKIESMQKDILMLAEDDTRTRKDKEEDTALQDELAAELEESAPVEDTADQLPPELLAGLGGEEAAPEVAPVEEPAAALPQEAAPAEQGGSPLSLFEQITGGAR